MCSPNLEYQHINPSTQVALNSDCDGECRSLRSMRWNIYQGVNDSKVAIVHWTPFTSSNFHYYGTENSFFSRRF